MSKKKEDRYMVVAFSKVTHMFVVMIRPESEATKLYQDALLNSKSWGTVMIGKLVSIDGEDEV